MNVWVEMNIDGSFIKCDLATKSPGIETLHLTASLLGGMLIGYG
jgi:hypothetical protein